MTVTIGHISGATVISCFDKAENENFLIFFQEFRNFVDGAIETMEYSQSCKVSNL